jgi:hypothetical protein
MNKVLVRSKESNRRLSDVSSTLAHDLCRYRKLHLPLYDRHQCTTVAFANNGIYFPVAYSRLTINNAWSIIYANAVDYLASRRLPIATLIVSLSLLA